MQKYLRKLVLTELKIKLSVYRKWTLISQEQKMSTDEKYHFLMKTCIFIDKKLNLEGFYKYDVMCFAFL